MKEIVAGLLSRDVQEGAMNTTDSVNTDRSDGTERRRNGKVTERKVVAWCESTITWHASAESGRYTIEQRRASCKNASPVN